MTTILLVSLVLSCQQGEIDSMFDETVTAVANTRGLTLKPVQRWTIDRSRLRGKFEELTYAAMGRAATEDYCRRKQLAWEFLGLIPPGTDLLKDSLDHYSDAVLGYYAYSRNVPKGLTILSDITAEGRARLRADLQDRWTKAESVTDIRTISKAWGMMEGLRNDELTHRFSQARATLFHELLHAAQDQTWELPRFDGGDSTDMELAFSALIEGDARTAEIEYVLGPERAPGLLAIYREGYLGLLAKADREPRPRFLRVLSDFPYSQGSDFILQVRRARGSHWRGINDLYREPACTTRAILHPEVLGRDDDARSVRLILPEELGTPVWNDSLGELGFRFLLRSVVSNGKVRSLLKPSEADRIAAGWRGDRYQGMRQADDQLSLAWVTIWSDARAAREFLATYAKILGWKAPGAWIVQDEVDRFEIREAEGISTVFREENRVLIAELVPEAKLKALEQLLRSAPTAPIVFKADPRGDFRCPSHPSWTAPAAYGCRYCGRTLEQSGK